MAGVGSFVPLRVEEDRGLTRIVGGVSAKDGSWPSQVKIYAPDPAGRGRLRSHCGGTVIGANFVLTAAHCFIAPTADGGRQQTLAAPEVMVMAGRTRLPPIMTQGEAVAGLGIRARAVYIHPDFQPGTYANDIALVELEAPAQVPAMAVVGAEAAGEDMAGLASTVVGWGFTQEAVGADADLLPADLQEVELPLVSIAACRAAYADSPLRGNVIGPSNLCAGYAAGGRDACRGDSGGPLMMRGAGGGWVQAGVVSWGEGCGRRGRYGVYTRVAAFEPWLRLMTRGQMAPAALPSRHFPLLSSAEPAADGETGHAQGGAPAPLSPDKLAATAAAAAPGDRALVIGIDRYPAPLSLSGSAEDAAAVAAALVDVLGFRREQVMVLTDEKATRANILAAADGWITQGSRPGARVFLYFSGQGFQSRAFPALRDGQPGAGLAPVDLELERNADGQVWNVARAITPAEVARLLGRLADRKVTAIFDTTQVSRRALQRPVRARAGEEGLVRAVEAVVDLASAQREIMVRSDIGTLELPAAAALWFAAAPDQWALVDRVGDEAPMGAFTRRWVGAVRALRLMNGGGGDAAGLLETVRAGLSQFCEGPVSLCRLGLSPQLDAPAAVLRAPVLGQAGAALFAARSSLPPIANSAGLALEWEPGAARVLRAVSRAPGYLILLSLTTDGRARQIYPDLASLEHAGRGAREMNRMEADRPLQVALPRAEGAILLAVFSDRPVQALDVPERPGESGDALGALASLYDAIRTLSVPDPATGRVTDVAWSFATKLDGDAAPPGVAASNAVGGR